MNYYLEFTYVSGPKAGRAVRMGPFKAKKHAELHRRRYGPAEAKIVHHDPKSETDETN